MYRVVSEATQTCRHQHVISSFKSRFAEQSAVSLLLFALHVPWPQVLHGNDYHDHYDYDNDDHNNNLGTSLHSPLLRTPCSKQQVSSDLDLDIYPFVTQAAGTRMQRLVIAASAQCDGPCNMANSSVAT